MPPSVDIPNKVVFLLALDRPMPPPPSSLCPRPSSSSSASASARRRIALPLELTPPFGPGRGRRGAAGGGICGPPRVTQGKQCYTAAVVYTTTASVACYYEAAATHTALSGATKFIIQQLQAAPSSSPGRMHNEGIHSFVRRAGVADHPPTARAVEGGSPTTYAPHCNKCHYYNLEVGVPFLEVVCIEARWVCGMKYCRR